MTTGTVINFLCELFARFGIADCILSDDGSQFTSQEFKDFCWTFVVEHVTIAPYHLRSNGQAERFVDTFKRALKKVKGTPTDTAIQQFLQVYWITPNENAPTDMTPARVDVCQKDQVGGRQTNNTETKTKIFEQSYD